MIVNKEVIETVDKWTEKKLKWMRWGTWKLWTIELQISRNLEEKNRREGEKMTIENEKESIADGWEEKKELAKLDISAGILFTAFIDRH